MCQGSGGVGGWEGEVASMLDSGFRLAECAPLFYTVKVVPMLPGDHNGHTRDCRDLAGLCVRKFCCASSKI